MNELTEVERLKMENYNLRIHILQQQTQQTINERQSLVRSIELEHPGFEWDEQHGRLVDKEDIDSMVS